MMPGVIAREKELAAQVEDQRAMYTRKIKDLEARLKVRSSQVMCSCKLTRGVLVGG
jgi:hypothetical protein